jgi:DNA-binding NtrC family response regulator
MGDLSIASREGEGTCVSVAIPRGEAPYEARPLEVADGGIQRETRVGRVDVYIIDDDREHGASLGRLLGSFGAETRQSDSLETFLRDFQREPVSSVLCDAHMPDGGAERLLPILATCPNPPRLAVVSGDASDDQLYRLAALGAQAFFTKPVDIDEVVAWVRGG